MRTPGETSFKSFQKMERYTADIQEKQLANIQRGLAGEDTAAEFMDLVKKKNMAYQGMGAMLKLNHKPLQKILDESR